MIAVDMIEMCAPHVAPATVAHIIQVESSGDPLAINVNKGIQLSRKPTTAAEAVAMVKQVLAAGAPGVSVDMGLMQVNSRNLAHLGYSVEEMFQPCTNIAAGAAVLSAFYTRAQKQFGSGQSALLAALSAYNTGDFKAGFNNGYVARYTGKKNYPMRASVVSVDPFTADTTVYIRRQESTTMQTPQGDSPVTSTNLNDASIAGVQVEVDAGEAERLGAFTETALSDEDAWEANADLDSVDTTPASAAQGARVVAFPSGGAAGSSDNG